MNLINRPWTPEEEDGEEILSLFFNGNKRS